MFLRYRKMPLHASTTKLWVDGLRRCVEQQLEHVQKYVAVKSLCTMLVFHTQQMIPNLSRFASGASPATPAGGTPARPPAFCHKKKGVRGLVVSKTRLRHDAGLGGSPVAKRTGIKR